MPAPRSRSASVGPVAVAVAVVLSAALGCGADRGVALRAEASPDATVGTEVFTGGIPVEDAVDETGKTEVTIAVKDNVFEARAVKVSPGTKVTWANLGANPHNVIPSNDGQFPDIPTSKLDPTMTASVVLDAPGAYPYHCSIHGTRNKGQRGLVVVG